ncbi:hypothetical protein HanIR_Chr14g0705031 [Helianthus annuus]|nr:hypothetical protein HanIR_Chr14g0705031 [Helianthus annuus]
MASAATPAAFSLLPPPPSTSHRRKIKQCSAMASESRPDPISAVVEGMVVCGGFDGGLWCGLTVNDGLDCGLGLLRSETVVVGLMATVVVGLMATVVVVFYVCVVHEGGWSTTGHGGRRYVL